MLNLRRETHVMPTSLRSFSVSVRKILRSMSCSSSRGRYLLNPICSRNSARSCDTFTGTGQEHIAIWNPIEEFANTHTPWVQCMKEEVQRKTAPHGNLRCCKDSCLWSAGVCWIDVDNSSSLDRNPANTNETSSEQSVGDFCCKLQ